MDNSRSRLSFLVEQVDVSEELYGGNLKFYFTRKDVDDILSQ